MSNDEKVKNKSDSKQLPTHSLKLLASFSAASLGLGIITTSIAMQLLYYYEVLLQMPVALFTLGYLIYTIWDAINDPIMGFISDRPKSFWKKYGKRFPWVMIAFIPVCITFALIFSPPTGDNMLLFVWFLINLVIFDTFRSIWSINYGALLYEKYIGDYERTKVAGFNNIFRQFGGVLAMMLPAFLINYLDPSSFSNFGIFVAIFSAICILIAIPGLREEAWMKQRAAMQTESGAFKATSLSDFFSTMKASFKIRNFLVFLIVGTCFYLMMIMQQASTPYYVTYILGLGAEAQAAIYLPYLLIIIIVSPFAVKIAKKVNNPVKMFKYLLFATGIGALLLLFPSDLISAVIVQSIIAAISGFSVIIMTPVIGMMLDETTLKFKAHKEGILLGINVVFQVLAGFFSTFIILVIHGITGFDATAGATQTSLAIFGLRLHIAIIPAIIILIAGLIFLKGWTLTGKRMEEVRDQLKEMKLSY